MLSSKWILGAFVFGAVTLTSVQASWGAQGTTQLKGIDAVFNRPYSIGPKGGTMQILLRSIEYTIAPVLIGTTIYTPKKDEKLMVVKFQVQNAEKRDQHMGWSAFRVTAVGGDDTNYTYVQEFGNASNHLRLQGPMKAAQKAEAFAVIRVKSKGEIPKLIFERSVEPILRFDIRGKAKGLPAPYADPSDPTGYSVADEFNAKMGTDYISDSLQFRVTKVNAPASAFGKTKPRKGFELVAVELTVKNDGLRMESIGWATLRFDMTDARWLQGFYKADGASGNISLDPGKSVTAYAMFEVEAGVKPKELKITSRDGRKAIYSF